MQSLENGSSRGSARQTKPLAPRIETVFAHGPSDVCTTKMGIVDPREDNEMNQKALALSMVGAGAGLAAGLLYVQRTRSNSRTAAELERQSEADRRSHHGEHHRYALLAHPGPSRTKLLLGAGSGLLAAWGTTRGGLVGNTAGLAGAALLSRLSTH